MELAILLIISALAAVTAQTPPYLITVPSIVHVGVEETVTVQLHAATKPVTITLYFEHQNNVLSDRQSVTLTEGNSYQAVVKLKVKPDLYKDVKFQGTKTYVHLVAEGNDVFGGPKRATCLLSTRKGYIFIQTDKPIYNPGETVSFRIFTLDNYMRPTDETINLKIFNSKGLMVYRGDVKSEQIYERHVDIPGVEPAGYWKIVASFSNLPMSNTSVEFEVREYVLPSFEVKIEPVKKYHLLKDESFKFGVSARYTYGKGVNGIAYVRFGIIDEQGNKTFLPGLEKQTAIRDGNSEIALLTKDLREKAESLNADIEGRHVYIAVTVLETASGELEEAESSSVKIVNSPFSIDLSKTKRYFTPEGMFSILATTTYPDGTPAPGLLVKASVQAKGEITERIEITEKSGNNDGEVALQFKVPRLAASLDIKVFANGEDQDVVLSDAHMTATATSSESKSYLSVEVPHLVLQKGQEMKVTFRDITPPGRKRPTHIYYMIFSKGRVVKMDKVQRSEVTSISLPFSYDLVPTFRVLAYYFTGPTEFVADSVWVDVEDVCEGQVRIQPFEKEYKPGANVDVVIHTDQAERVALVAVDTAVYILNKQNKLTAQKMFDYMNSYDLACSKGGGKDHRSVLTDAGLTFISSFAEAPDATGLSCHSVRQKRATAKQYSQEFSAIVNKYNQPEKRKCCNDGARLHLRMTCEQRQAKTRHRSAACQEAFLQCCRDAAALRDKIRQAQRRQSVARTGGDDNLDALNEAFIHLRSYFPQSWMWQIKHVDASGTVRHNDNLPDSITTWEIQTIGISQGKGFCVAEPQRLKVFQDFFVSLKLPYSVKRNEQLEVKAVVYNYKTEPLEVTVKMASAEGLCTAGGGGDAGVRTVSVPANSAVPVYFTVIPLKVARIPIHMTAFASQSAADQIKKYLNVVGEGELVSVPTEYSLEARGAKVLEIDIPEPADAIPGLESAASISIRGGVMGESADNCLNLEGIDRLIELPTGCAEQTMVKMSPAINAMKYLDATDQWLFLSPQRRGEAKAMIQSGYTTVLTHMKNDGSYGAFKTTPSSIWLTAFIAKELTRARDIIAVEDSYILRSVSYLVSKQQSNGAFTDPNPVYDRTMQGGVGGVEGDVSLTAFVLVTMVHSVPVFPTAEGTKTRMAMMQAQDYLEGKLDSLQRPFALAITAYALSLASPGSAAATRAKGKLREMATCDDAKGTCHWEAKENLRLAGEKKATQVPKADSISVETTAYALLAALSRDEQDLQHATKIARWLTEQRQYGGGFRSTQDTVVALEALAALSGRINDVEGLDLNVELCLSKSRREKVRLTKRNALTQPSFQATPGSKVTVDVTGTGNGTLSLLQTYRSMKRAVLYCDYYQLSVSLEGEVAYQPVVDGEPDLDDYYNYEAGEAREEPMDRVEWFDLRTRRKRHAPSEPERETSLIYTVCVSMKGRNSTGMAIVDISLLSGLEPNMQDLEDQVKGTEKYIDHYDLGKNKVYLYFNQITENTDCVTFGAKQITPMGLVQPASAVIYDYYNPDRRCSVFYSAPQKSTMLSKLCSGDVCACAEGHCPKTKVTFSKNMQEDTRKEYACFSPVVSYVYVVKVLNSTEDGVFQYYTVTVTRVLQIGPDETVRADVVRELVQRKSCDEFQMKSGRDYLVMGGASTVTRTRDANGEFRYLLSNEVWVEEIPEERKCQATKNRNACQLLNAFMEQYELQQCAI
ncbi:complement C4-A [Anguilla rostrata]|uniref:complement C4-A n=1 Tax=Anguilla rostrata TaxID=7938 RepID=UPI0030CB6694